MYDWIPGPLVEKLIHVVDLDVNIAIFIDDMELEMISRPASAQTGATLVN